MSTQGLKSLRPDLFPDEENGKCGIARYCAEFPSIGCHSLKQTRTRGGRDDWRHSLSQWKPEQNIIIKVVRVKMATNALLCDRGRSYDEFFMYITSSSTQVKLSCYPITNDIDNHTYRNVN